MHKRKSRMLGVLSTLAAFVVLLAACAAPPAAPAGDAAAPAEDAGSGEAVTLTIATVNNPGHAGHGRLYRCV